MTFTATPQPSNVPPRVLLELDTGDPLVAYTSIAIKRDGSLIREQPFVGSQAALTFDYEAPFGQSVTYDVSGTTAGFSSLYATLWPNLSGWTTASGSPAVAGGKLVTASTANITRPLTALTAGKITIAAGMTDGAELSVPTSPGDAPVLIGIFGGTPYLSYGSGGYQAFDKGTGVISVVFDDTEATVTTTAGTWGVSRAGLSSDALLRCRLTSATSVLPAITIYSLTGEVVFSDSDTTTLDVDEAWLIHPSQPTLSCSIDPGANNWRDDGINVDIGTKPNLSRRAVATTFNPVGRTRAVVVTHGNRLEGDWTLNLFTPRLEDRDTVSAIITDQTPLLFRAPQDWEWDLPDGWYSVGDVDEARSFPAAGLQQPYRNTILPLTPVDAPIVRQGTLWSYGDGLLRNATYSASLLEFPTYLDRLAGPAA